MAWVLLSNSTGSFAFRHPPDWYFVNCPGNGLNAASATQVDTPSVGPCAGEGSGYFSVIVMSIVGDHQSAPANHEYMWVGTVQSASSVTVDSASGTRSTALVQTDPGLGPEGGTTQILYVFFTGGRTYLILYQHRPALTDETATFDQLVQGTFRFSV